MKISTVTHEDLWQSVIAVPPIARSANGDLSPEENKKLVDYLWKGDVKTILWGGNANLYHMGLSEYSIFLDMVEEIAHSDNWMIPSIGPDYGKAMDQIAVLKERDFPSAMVLPMSFPTTSSGVASGLRKLADKYGRPVIGYVKNEDYITTDDLQRLVQDGVLASIKYANVKSNPDIDYYLSDLVQKVDPRMIVSGIGERPVISHLEKFKLTGFTSGSVCLAPAISSALLRAMKVGDLQMAKELIPLFLDMEDLRDGYSPIRVLHTAVSESGIADMGELAAFLSNISDPVLKSRICITARKLRELNNDYLV